MSRDRGLACGPGFTIGDMPQRPVTRKTLKRPATAREVRTRLTRVHKASGSTDALHIWFAGLARVAPWSVTRWLTGQRQFRGAALALLEQLEAQL